VETVHSFVSHASEKYIAGHQFEVNGTTYEFNDGMYFKQVGFMKDG